MISKKHRLSNFDFEKFFKKAKKKENDIFQIWENKTESELSRFSIASSKKIFKNAVQRNKIRRKIFETLRLNINQVKKADYVIIPKESIIKLNANEISKKILELIAR